MALTLTPGSESRLDGAPDLPLPHRQDRILAIAARLLEEDAEGALYGGDIRNAMAYATQLAVEGDRARMASAVAGGTASAERRAADRMAAQGVAPESLPMDQYGSVSGRTVQEANRPPEDAEAALMQDQNVADEIVRGYREGDRNWQAEGDRQYSQEYGLGGFDRGPGRSDLDYRRRIQEQQGFIRTPQGMVPIGPQITPERVESMAEFDDWANQNPGTERQALYAPEEYAQYREGVRNDIRDNARAEMAMYGTGTDEQLQESAEAGNRDAERQLDARKNRKKSEDRVRNAQRGDFYRQRLEADAGMTAEQAKGKTEDELRAVVYKQKYAARQRDLASRKQNRREQAMMAGGQPTGGPFGTRATTTAINQLGDGWREIALLDRLTNGRVGGPTPLGVEAVGAQNAMRAFTADVLAGNQPGVREQREIAAANAEAGLPIPVRADRERDKNNGVLPANSAAGQAVLQDIATTTIGSSYATQDEFDRAVERAVAEGIPEADAIAFFNRHAQFANSGFWGTILGAGNFGAPPAPGDNPGLPPPGSIAPPM